MKLSAVWCIGFLLMAWIIDRPDYHHRLADSSNYRLLYSDDGRFKLQTKALYFGWEDEGIYESREQAMERMQRDMNYCSNKLKDEAVVWHKCDLSATSDGTDLKRRVSELEQELRKLK